MKRIIVISEQTSDRLNYVVTFLMSIWDVTIIVNATDINENDFVINYGNTISVFSDITIPNENLLFCNGPCLIAKCLGCITSIFGSAKSRKTGRCH